MEENTNVNLENQEASLANKTEQSTAKTQKPDPKTQKLLIAIGAGLAVVALTLILIFVVFKHEHTWSAWETTQEATCTTNGSETRKCTNEKCGEVETAIIYSSGHSWGLWKTTKQKTCTENGSEERVCSCGAKETKTIYCTGHNFADSGICMDCRYGWVTIKLPETPLTLTGNLATFEISDIRYGIGRNNSGYYFRIYYSGTQIYSFKDKDQSCIMDYKLVDSNGYTVYSSFTNTPKLTAGDKVKDRSFDSDYIDLDPNETYTLIISSRG